MSAFKISVDKLTEKMYLRRSMIKWEDHIRLDIKEMCVTARNCVESAQDRDYWRSFVNSAMIIRV